MTTGTNHNNLIFHTSNRVTNELQVCNSGAVARVGVLVASAAAGTCWLLALFLPWTTTGALSSASLLDAVELVRGGAVDAIVPSGVAVLLLVPAGAGIALIALAGISGRAAAAARAVALATGSLGSTGLAWRLTDAHLSAAGPGTWVALVGVILAVGALGFSINAVAADGSSAP